MKIKSLPLATLILVASNVAAIAQTETPEILVDETPEGVQIIPINEAENFDFEFSIIDEILNQPIYAPFRQEGTVQDSSRPAYVINREQIEAQGYRTVNEALKYFPGVFVDSTAGVQLGAQSAQILRGANSNSQTLILLDGRPINTFNVGTFDLSNLTTSNVERIELLPGGSSTLFGSSAIGGVINIVTRQPELNGGWSATIGGEIGTLGYNNQEVAVNYGGEKSTVRLAYNRTAAENDFDFKLENLGLSGTRENAQAEIQNLNFQATSLLGDRHKLSFNGLYTDKDIGVPGGFPNPALEQFAEVENWLLSLQLDSRLGNGDDSTLITRIFADFADNLDKNPAGPFPFTFITENESFGGQIQHNWQFAKNQNITYGFDYRSEDIVAKNAFGTLYDGNLSQGAIFANYTAGITPELTTTLGLRQDFNSLAEGSFTSPSAGLLWQAGENTSIRANYARNFRTPTSTDLFFPGSANPNLKPEIGNSFDIGIDQKFGRNALLRLTYFNNTIDDAIVLDPTFTPFNLGKARNQGLEAELTVQLSNSVYAFANYTMNNSKILEDSNASVIGNEVRFAGTDFFNIGIAYENPQGFYAGLFVKHVGDRLTNNTNTASLESYTTVDLRTRYAITDNVNLTASWENILAEDYITFSGFSGDFPGVGSRFQIGVNATFR
ncbi:TonB-dependent receptor [[Limnothrix rosea] IAM M-220]|uniref:TonB-dependent receptor n=1 Tax=[Limnothrix rosea] IAM M-220 TaxID=454133 RepID=UPI0009681133|nr:TonB-dependent receptor [[Limnothrix rosea] IAM M-220]OKH18323.1 TonB-dependent receptor [[Limnothrix rosea] IAM M-220]